MCVLFVKQKIIAELYAILVSPELLGGKSLHIKSQNHFG